MLLLEQEFLYEHCLVPVITLFRLSQLLYARSVVCSHFVVSALY